MNHSALTDEEFLRRANEELGRKPSALWGAYICLLLTYVMLWCWMQP